MPQQDPLEPSKARLSASSMDGEAKRLTDAAKARQTAWALSLAGAIPFVVLALSIAAMSSTHPLNNLAQDLLKTYAAVILSFLGGIRWGHAMRSADQETGQRVFIYSVIPSLIGWFAILLPVPFVYAIFAMAFAGQGAWDSFAGQNGVFGLWFAKLRMVITLIVVASMVIAFFATIA